MKRIRNSARKDFEALRSRSVEAITRSYVAKAVVTAGLLLLAILAWFAARNDKGSELRSIVSSVTTLMSFVLGHYFARRRGE